MNTLGASQPEEAKLVIGEFQRPLRKKDMQSFLGLAGYYSSPI